MARPASTSAAQIEDVALDLFLERGYAAVSAADIAGACGISRPTLFRHVPSLDALVMAPVARFGALHVARCAASSVPDPWERLLTSFQEAWAAAEPGSAIARAFAVLASDPGIRGEAMVRARDWRQGLAAALGDGGVRDPVEAEALAGAAVGIITAAFARGWGVDELGRAFAALRRP